MPKFIKVSGTDSSGNARYVNTESVVYIEGGEKYTIILLETKDMVKTIETPDQIMEMINDRPNR